ncbi:uncharacterized protein LOC111086756 isoform X2 [Limulus polyphemus]|uniref:Uncharacterized protein LOC111086756 isoform X2 n=1 Tax=Limulus polyphemus TaxID=6850 RepID=A0ABM1SSL1_LIMPO|nr:uncharacterized protein LOC111086756 isoform X2 [Limulus polyphemus]
MDPENNMYVGLNPYWNEEDEQYDNCDCPGPPPPEFMIPPPPAPPYLQMCQGQNSDLQYCDVQPLGAEYTHPTFPSLPVIAVCCSVVLVAILVVSFLLWKHKRKVQNFLPCKSEHQPSCDIPSSNGVTYDDVLISHHPTRIPTVGPNSQNLTPIEFLDVKYGGYGPSQFSHANFAFSGKQMGSMIYNKSKENFNPIYEEVSGGSDGKVEHRSGDSDIEDSETEARIIGSEDEFAEDELSLAEFPTEASQVGSCTINLQGSTEGNLCSNVASGSSEGAFADHSDSRELRGRFRGDKGGCTARKNGGHSLEHNRNVHVSEGVHAKHQYYLDKITNGTDQDPSLQGRVNDPFPQYSMKPENHRNKSGLLLNTKIIARDSGNLRSGNKEMRSGHPTDKRSQKRSTESLAPLPNPFTQHQDQTPAVYSPTPGSKSGRLPGAVLSELNQRIGGSGKRTGVHSANQSRNSPILNSQRSMAPVELGTFRPTSGAKPLPNPMKDNIYASINEDQSYTNEGSCQYTSRSPGNTRHNINRWGVPKDWNKALISQHIPPAHSTEEQESYGDIRPANDSTIIGT